MKIRFLILNILIVLMFISCEKEVYDNTVKGFSKLESDLVRKFGKNSYFTDFIINVDEQQKLEINLLVTNNPYNYQMDGWHYKEGSWTKVTKVYLELRNGDMKNYLYSINNEVNIVKLGFLVDTAFDYVLKNNFHDPKLRTIQIISPNKGRKSKRGYIIEFFLNNKKIKYYYNLNGDLIKEETL